MNTKLFSSMFAAKLTVITSCLSVALIGRAVSPNLQKLADANTRFAFKLLNEIANERPKTNIFISPYSVSESLQMAANGAGNSTLEEMRQSLGIAGLSPSAQNEANRNLNRMIRADSGNMTLNVTNAMWYRDGIHMKPEFLSRNQNYYQTSVKGLNFDEPSAVEIINSWVKNATDGKIPSMLSERIDPKTSLFLANAVYFKCDWMIPFDIKKTKDRDFHLIDGVQKKIPMMLQSSSFLYFRGAGYQAVRLPYKNRKLGMYVILPDTNSDPVRLLKLMNGENWERVTKSLREEKGTLLLPRFKLEFEVDLKPPLEMLGIKSAFTQTANFSAMCDEPVFISKLLQKSFVEVNETGTEAAAATRVDISTAIVEPNRQKPFELNVDRPFLFFIQDDESKSILFMGIIFDPTP